MRIIVLIAGIVLLPGFKNYGQGPFTVSGTLKNSPSKVVYLEEAEIATGKKTMRDSSVINKDGSFSIEINAAGEEIYDLRLKNDIPPFATIINDANNISIDADFNNKFNFYETSGSRASKTVQGYLSRLSDLRREKFTILFQIDSIKKSNGASSLIEKLDTRHKEINKEFKLFTEQTIQQADKAPLALFILATYQGVANDPNNRVEGFTAQEMLVFVDAMIKKFPARADLGGIRTSIQSQIRQSWIGKQAPEISLPDTEGKVVSLSSFRGKYVLVDFWASWCRPCRMENPNVVNAYNQFKEKNFTVLGVSLDQNIDAWKKAIVDDNLNWTHISDLRYWQSEVVPVYGIQGIPFNVLVDPRGNVVAENLRGSALEEKLAQTLGGEFVKKTNNTVIYIISAVALLLLLLWFFVYKKKKKPPVKPQTRNQIKKKRSK
jgi:peroxiredoxin